MTIRGRKEKEKRTKGRNLVLNSSDILHAGFKDGWAIQGRVNFIMDRGHRPHHRKKSPIVRLAFAGSAPNDQAGILIRPDCPPSNYSLASRNGKCRSLRQASGVGAVSLPVSSRRAAKVTR